MTFDIIGTQIQKDSISGMADALTATLGNKIKDVTVVFKAADDMKRRSDGGPSNGYWTRSKRQISLREELDEYNVEKTFAHEVMHVVDTDWLTDDQRKEIVKLMDPPPEDWKDMAIDGERMKYVSDPSEVFAVYASAAIADLEKPAYTRMYLRSIVQPRWGDLKSLIMRGDDKGDRGSTDVEEIVVPPDTAEDLQDQLRETKKKLNDAKAALLPLQNELTDTKKALEGAKGEAKAARDQLAPVQTRLDEAKSQLTTAQTQLAEAKSQLVPTQADLTTAQADLATAQAD